MDSLFWDAEVEVEYNGHYKVYDIDFNALGVDSLNVDTDDFPATIIGNG